MKLATGVTLTPIDLAAAAQVARAVATVNPKIAEASGDFVAEVCNSATALSSLFLEKFSSRDLTIQAVALIQVLRELMVMHDQLDSLSELGEEQQLRLQMLLQRLQKMLQMLSNIMYRIAQTAQSIIQNMK